MMMRDILPQLDRWREEGRKIALAAVVQTWGSAPRRPGARMAITADGEFAGSVSGGCVEAAVIEAAQESLRTGKPRLLHFAVSDDTAWEVGLACGGSIDVFVKPLDSQLFDAMRAILRDEAEGALVTVIRAPQDLLGRELLVRADGSTTGVFGRGLDESALRLAMEIMTSGGVRQAALNESFEVFVEAIQPPPLLVAVGGVQIAIALVTLAKTLGFRTVVIDPRRAWNTPERLGHADRILAEWPEQAFRSLHLTGSTAVAVLTHDARLDDPALIAALQSPAFYVGALGSRKTQALRRERLLTTGLSEEHLSRLRAPIGLELGAETPEEIALAIMAEIVAARRGSATGSVPSAASSLQTAI